MVTLVVDVGGRNVKVWRSGERDKFKFASGPDLTPKECVRQVKKRVDDFSFDRISLGYPGEVRYGAPVKEPINLGGRWVGFDFEAEFGGPVRIMNDACMQALGSYEGGRMLYVGLGTGVGSVFVIDGAIVPLALGDLRVLRGGTLHEFMSREALERLGLKVWRKKVALATPILKRAFLADSVVLGGGNAKRLETIPEGTRRGGNHFAYLGGLRMWDDTAAAQAFGGADSGANKVDEKSAILFASRKRS